MIKNRIIPTVGICWLIPLLVWAQDPASTPPPDAAAGTRPPEAMANAAPAVPAAPPTEAELTLDEAAKKVAALASVAADLDQKVEMLKQKFEIQGRYVKAPGERLYLRLVVSGLPGATGEMRQVSDGVTLWDFQQVLESKYCRKVMLAPVLEKLKSADLDDAAREQVMTQLGVAGPDVLLVGLRKAVHFDQKEEGTYDGRPVWILRGTWQDRQGLLGPNQQPLPEKAPLPPYVPSQATLTIGKEDGWPYKVRLAGRVPTMLLDTRRIGPDGRPIGPRTSIQSIEPSVVDLTYTNVTLDPTLRGDEFDFTPPDNLRPDDITESLLNGLEQMIQAKIAQKKAESARAEPLLNQSISVPKAKSPSEATSPTPPPLAKPR
jgi:outer membrane lipoprotein-sorting protein